MLPTPHRKPRVGKRHAIPKAKLAVAILAVLLLVSMERLAPPKAGRSASRSPRITRPWSDRCVGVADGDTISVMYKGREVRIRLNGVDSPERNQAFAAVARQFTSDMVFGKVVTVNPTATDRYGRTVADVLMPNGESLNEALVGAGLAWWFRRYAPNNTRLQELEAEARQAKRGLWRDANPIPPWEFRQGR